MRMQNIFLVLDAMGIDTPLKRVGFLCALLIILFFVAPRLF